MKQQFSRQWKSKDPEMETNEVSSKFIPFYCLFMGYGVWGRIEETDRLPAMNDGAECPEKLR